MLDARGKHLPVDFDPASLLAPESDSSRRARPAGKR
jgi:hypothetical protein